MNDKDLKKISGELILDLEGLQSGRLTLIASSSSTLNEKLILGILENSILSTKALKYYKHFSRTFDEFLFSCEHEKKTNGLDLVAINDIQFFHVDDNVSNYDHMSNLSRYFKSLSKDLNCHVIIAISIAPHLNENLPMIFPRLREIGSLEVDADAILFVDENDDNDVKITIVKNRLGAGYKTFK